MINQESKKENKEISLGDILSNIKTDTDNFFAISEEFIKNFKKGDLKND